MERGIYFDGWHKNNHCYHPSLPIRSRQMIEDIEKYKGTLLVWSMLGGGSISLPYLEHEAFGDIDPRLRFYGFMNDSEFIAECSKRGIKAFGIVFEVQGWEFPAIPNSSGTGFKALNVIDPNDQNHDWYGLREFTQDKHYQVFGKRFRDYFPEGLYNSDGQEVTDIWEECCSRDYNGVPVHTEWVEVVNHKHAAYQMCRNNPVWRAYLKKIIEIQIDAGVAGVQLDECELPMTSIRYGGCFCKDCMKQFNEYLKTLIDNGESIEELKNISLDHFNYGDYLRERKIAYPGNVEDVPLMRYYWDYQLRATRKHFKELSDYIRDYGLTKNREVLVSGNFFNILPAYYPMETEVDVIITEMKQSLLQQSYWYRYVAGFAGEKPVIIAENPYGGFIINLVEKLNRGIGYDIYRLMMYEASAYGCNMSVPYGAWMGNTVKDAFWPPREVTAEIQNFITDYDHLYSTKSGAKVLLIFSFPSYYWREAITGYLVDDKEADEGLLSCNIMDISDPDSYRMPFWEIAKYLSDNQICFDVRFLADGDLREDDFSAETIADYDQVILPDCEVLTLNQTQQLERYLDDGHQILVFGRAAENITGWLDKIKQNNNLIYCDNEAYKPAALAAFDKAFEQNYQTQWFVRSDNKSVGLQTHLFDDRLAIHLINYNYSEDKDSVIPLPEFTVEINTKESSYTDIKIHTPQGSNINCESSEADHILNIKIQNLPLYSIIELKRI